MVPMLYGWTDIARDAASRQRLFLRDGDVYGSEPEEALTGGAG
jgi:hypothetical protein